MEKNLEGAKLSMEQSKLNLTNAEENLNNTIIKAPFSGIFVNISVKLGDIITSNRTLFTLLDTTNVELNLEVDETDIGKVSVGLPVRISSDAFSEEILKERL
ncbi:MAG: efflux RND transporter periplasmic adaptor subunit [Dictyoglomus sp.]|nr:efflux RND transporter periplasmic adaptor subunit [Dictyoglomus sp.]MCX7942034.1 efflux RND transporter periplasmic adaptor subunit [Dictyoglomaceae bacterium]MDW8188705.1 efflux RND transporter periplasmic adaptor subunit [Dictyoglomus sp.]